MISKYLTETPNIKLLEEKGFLTIKVCNDVITCIENILSTGKIFFNQDKIEKKKSSIPHLNEGWRDLGGEFSIIPERPDLHESFWITQLNKEKVHSVYSDLALRLHRQMLEYITILNIIERGITKQLMKYYGCDDSTSQVFRCDVDSDLQMLYYQPSIHNRDFLQDPHDDSLYMTFAKADRAGLELLLSDNNYHPVNLKPNEILVMPGEILALLTGYKINPMIHRVVRHKEQAERYALGYFAFPNITSGQKINPWFSNEKNEGIDIMRKVIENQIQFLVN